MVTWNDFDKIWASTSPLTPYSFSDPNYAQGWDFVGSTPPARQMWDSIQKKNDEKFKYLRDNFGTPNIVTQASQMTDTEKVYVYIGSEAGWNNGHWYFWDGSAWADGGVYNSVAFVTDTTLSIAGQPADAKATGDALALKADLAGCTFTGNVTVTADLSVTGASTLAGDVTASSDLSVAGDSALANLSVSGTTALTGTSTAPTPSADDNSTKIATTEYVQTEIKPIETDVDIADKRITNIEKLLQGNLYDYQTDSSSAYTKSVPAGAMPYAGLEKVGGKTIVWNQLASPTTTMSITANTDRSDYIVQNIPFVAGHKYVASRYQVNTLTSYTRNTFNYNDGSSHYEPDIYQQTKLSAGRYWFFFTASGTTNSGYLRLWQSGLSDDCTTKDFIFCDLTLLYGAGNEPTTGEQFEVMFPASNYAISTPILLSAGVTEVVSKDSNNATLQTYSIPTEVQALEGYGWSAGTAYNYIEFERKVFVQNVARVDLGTLSYTRSTDAEGQITYYSDGLSSVIKIVDSNDDVGNIISTFGETRSLTQVNVAGSVKSISTSTNGNIQCFNKDMQTSSAATFKTSVSGVYLYYELATPIEVDISQYLTDDNLIEVEAGGILTFTNQHGDDYRIPVPSEETYMIDLQEAINNG